MINAYMKLAINNTLNFNKKKFKVDFITIGYSWELSLFFANFYTTQYK
jgi:hypothetical protein